MVTHACLAVMTLVGRKVMEQVCGCRARGSAVLLLSCAQVCRTVAVVRAGLLHCQGDNAAAVPLSVLYVRMETALPAVTLIPVLS